MSTEISGNVVTESLPDAIESGDIALSHIKYGFVVGLAAFVILIPFCRSRKSFFDALAARQTIWFARMFIFFEVLLLFCLYYFYFEHGQPMRMHQNLSYGNGDSWLYTYGRPTAGLVFIGAGMLGEVHPFIRIACMVGCMVQVMGDALSACQVRDYYRQVIYHDAPRYGYTSRELLAYYWRDIISLGTCTTIFLFIGLLTVMMGICEPQLIHPSLVSGNDLDRYTVMRNSKDQRKIMAMEGLLGPPKDYGLAGILKARQQTRDVLSPRPTVTGTRPAAGVDSEADTEGVGAAVATDTPAADIEAADRDR